MHMTCYKTVKTTLLENIKTENVIVERNILFYLNYTEHFNISFVVKYIFHWNRVTMAINLTSFYKTASFYMRR